MNAKRFIIALVAGFVALFLLSALWHLLIMGDFYKANRSPAAREQLQMGFIILGYVVLALLMAYIYPKGYSGGAPVTEGVKFGILIGLLWTLPRSIAIYGVENISGKLLIVDSIWHLIEQGIGGIVIGLVYGKKSE